MSNIQNQKNIILVKENLRKEMKVRIRWMIRRDIPEILEIEKKTFKFPWSREDFIRCFYQQNNFGMVAEYENRVIGYMIYFLSRKEIYLFNLAVRSDCRRHGVGSQMIAELISKLSFQGRIRILLEVCETNLGAQLFFRKMGFRAKTILKGFYKETSEDAYQMEYRLDNDQFKFRGKNRISGYFTA